MIDENKKLFYFREIKEIYTGYASQARLRENAASGGIVTAILIDLLKTRLISGALVSKLVVQNGDLQTTTFIATTQEEILSCQSSIYFNFNPITPSIIEDIISFNGKIAVVGLPCDISALNIYCQKDKAIADKIAYTIGLFCGHTSKKELILRILAKKNINLNDASLFRFRKGLWRGKCYVELKDGKHIVFPFEDYSLYQNLHMLSAQKCLYCSDFFAEHADIAVGDIWTSKMKKEAIKYSIYLSRTENGAGVLRNAIKRNTLNAKVSDLKMLYESNKRSLIFKKAIMARKHAFSLVGLKIKIAGEGPSPRWNELIAAQMIARLSKLCSTKRGLDFVFNLPRGILWLYLYIFKLLTNF